MIIDRIEDYKKHCLMHSHFEKVFEYLKNGVSADTKDGKYEILGKDVFAIVQSYETVAAGEKLFEAHRIYIDIQYVVSGTETIQWHPVKLLDLATEYNSEKDAAFYKLDKNASILKMSPGFFAVFFPEDGHIPGCLLDKSSLVKKVVVKIRV
ncbi:MAG: YhcH/YjgK/YiaL family protein [Elusimicrobia bacterium]|nr:YhcH/YjgK/YiaL family protein [Elusimicrobiota bacterium]MBU2614182.1 YhcH/YjgK/YiaL family protein [Elusimicrobiota bacterium]